MIQTLFRRIRGQLFVFPSCQVFPCLFLFLYFIYTNHGQTAASACRDAFALVQQALLRDISKHPSVARSVCTCVTRHAFGTLVIPLRSEQKTAPRLHSPAPVPSDPKAGALAVRSHISGAANIPVFAQSASVCNHGSGVSVCHGVSKVLSSCWPLYLG
jgi:hypothetical protein